jgi:acid phosphatase family membrane protein YuiD
LPHVLFFGISEILISYCAFFSSPSFFFLSETQLLHHGFTACIASHYTDLTVSCGTLQVMYDAFGVRLHAGKQAEV